MRSFLTTFVALFLGGAICGAAPKVTQLSGIVRDASTKEALCGVAISIGDNYLWAVTGEDGRFSIDKVQPASYILKASYLGYVDVSFSVDLTKDIEPLELSMQESSLALKEVVVTAQQPKDGLSTSRSLGRDALNHLQMSGMADMSALLPGGKTVNPDLTSSTTLSLRDGGTSAGNAAFGTAVEVDGVRIGNNAALAAPSGVDTRSISVDNIESIEVITGVPSAEYGDLNSGMVKVHTKKGRTPYNITLSVNPRTYQLSASKGFDLHKDRGVLNASLEWANATKKLTSPYESYTRRTASLSYSNTFANVLRLEVGATANIGGMNKKDDPDAYSGEYSKVRDNAYRANISMTYLLNKSWITNLKFDASASLGDNLSHIHAFNSSASLQPAAHATEEGYFLADRLPRTYFCDEMVDSKELDFAAALKYDWNKHWGNWKNHLKVGVQWKANGNAGAGEYYLDPSLAAHGYRPRPYSEYPFMHNFSVYAEDNITIPIGRTKLDLSAGLRLENVFIKDALYDKMTTLSPRFNAKWDFGEHFTLRGGWGITEKLPSFYILYPQQEYRDILAFGFSHGDSSSYIYYTQPYSIEYNPALRWQRNRNSELGLDASWGEFNLSLVGFYNVTSDPYKLSNEYAPFSYKVSKTPSGYAMPANPEITVDRRTGDVLVRGDDVNDGFWSAMDTKVQDRTFVKTSTQKNGATIRRAGVELTIDFPEIKPLRTSFRFDAAYAWSSYCDQSHNYYYQSGQSHSTLANRSYEYVGIYANGGTSNSVSNGRITHNFDGNLTSITHIPEARLIITCKLEMSFLTRSRNISRYNGEDYAFTVSEQGKTPTGGDISDGKSYTAIYPVAYVDLDGGVHHWTKEDAEDPAKAKLIVKSGNAYTFAQDGYDFYCSANLSVTKEIGKHVSLSFFANNFTNARPYKISMATGVGAIFTPSFYYGLTCRLKF